jgi:hypothetical protein
MTAPGSFISTIALTGRAGVADRDNDSRIWRWKKVDILFLVGVGIIVYGTVRRQIEIIVAGGGLSGIPLTQRGDKTP